MADELGRSTKGIEQALRRARRKLMIARAVKKPPLRQPFNEEESVDSNAAHPVSAKAEASYWWERFRNFPSTRAKR